MNRDARARMRRYLARYAEPEASLVSVLDGQYVGVLVVPVHREDPGFVDGYVAAADSAPGRVLCVAVVNEHDEADAACRAQSAELLRALQGRLSVSARGEGHVLGCAGEMDVLVVDRVTAGRRVPRREAVGLARKIGLDIAAAAYAEGRAGEVAYTTDADVALPPDYFVEPGDDAAGYLYPFVHVLADEEGVLEATLLHELFLRYWVAGLRFAGSPYAFHTVGSTIAVSLPYYAAVRGVPRRAGGEDFYLLNKLAKVGPLRRLRTTPVRIAARRSTRTPFGTGRAVERLARRALELPPPEAFLVLRRVLESLDVLAGDSNLAAFEAAIVGIGMGTVADGLARPSVLGVLERLCAQAPTAEDRSVRLAVWFDAFRTMRLLHALRDDGLRDVPWRVATRLAPFVPSESDQPGAVVAALACVEAEAPTLCGPTLERRSACKAR